MAELLHATASASKAPASGLAALLSLSPSPPLPRTQRERPSWPGSRVSSTWPLRACICQHAQERPRPQARCLNGWGHTCIVACPCPCITGNQACAMIECTGQRRLQADWRTIKGGIHKGRGEGSVQKGCASGKRRAGAWIACKWLGGEVMWRGVRTPCSCMHACRQRRQRMQLDHGPLRNSAAHVAAAALHLHAPTSVCRVDARGTHGWVPTGPGGLESRSRSQSGPRRHGIMTASPAPPPPRSARPLAAMP